MNHKIKNTNNKHIIKQDIENSKQYFDKNNNLLKVGDSLIDQKGDTAKIQNIGGVSMLVYKYKNSRVKKSIVLSKVDLSLMEKVV